MATDEELLAAFEKGIMGDDWDEIEIIAFHEAVKKNNLSYVEENAEDIDLNCNEDGTSPYLTEAETEEMRSLLISLGAR